MRALILLVPFVFVLICTVSTRINAQGARPLAENLEEFIINDNVINLEDPSPPDIAVINDQTGDFVVVWYNKFQDGGQDTLKQIYFKRYDSSGNPMDSYERALVDTNGIFPIESPSVDGLGDGGFLAVWTDDRYQGNYDSDVFGQYVNKDGTIVGDNQRLDNGIDASTEGPEIAIHDRGNGTGIGYLSWVAVDGDALDADDIYAVPFIFYINHPTSWFQDWISNGEHLDQTEPPQRFDGMPDIAVDKNGLFTVVWYRDDLDYYDPDNKIKFSTFFENDFEIREDTLYQDENLGFCYPSIATFYNSSSDTSFVVTWVEDGIKAQVFDSTGSAIHTSSIEVYGDQVPFSAFPRVSSFKRNDDFIVVWIVDDLLLAEAYNEAGDTVIYEQDFQIGSSIGENEKPHIDTFNDRIYVTWIKEDGGEKNIYVSILTVDVTAPVVDTLHEYPEHALIYDELDTLSIPIFAKIMEDSARVHSGIDSVMLYYTYTCPREDQMSGFGLMTRTSNPDSFHLNLPAISSPGMDISYYLIANDLAFNQRKKPINAPFEPLPHVFIANLGDVNINSIIDIFDFWLVVYHLYFGEDLADYERVFADYNEDGEIDWADADSIFKYQVNFDPDTLPSCGITPEDFEDYYFIEIGIGSAEAGSSDSIYIYLDNDSSSVKGIHLEIGYDDSSFSITDTSLTTRTSNFILASNCCPYPLINPSGVDQINLLGAEGDSLTPGSGPILELEFEVDDSTPDGYYHFYLTEEVLFAPNHKPVFTIPLRGKFFVPSPPPVSIVCTPIGDTLLTPGDTLTFNSTLTNHSDSTKSPKFFIYGTTAGPDSFTFLAVDTTQIMILPAGGRKRDITELEVPSGAPQGHYTFTAYVVSPVTDSTFDNDAFGFQVDSTYNRPGYGGNELSVTGTEIKPWKILSGWFGYNERNAEGSQGIGSSISLPKTFSIVQNFPNPFNPSTTIGYEIPNIDGSLPVNLSVYDLRGRLVIKLVDEEKTAGRYQVHWDGKNKQGQKVASGVYIYRIVVGDFVSTRKMILVR